MDCLYIVLFLFNLNLLFNTWFKRETSVLFVCAWRSVCTPIFSASQQQNVASWQRWWSWYWRAWGPRSLGRHQTAVAAWIMVLCRTSPFVRRSSSVFRARQSACSAPGTCFSTRTAWCVIFPVTSSAEADPLWLVVTGLGYVKVHDVCITIVGLGAFVHVFVKHYKAFIYFPPRFPLPIRVLIPHSHSPLEF